MSRPNFSSDQVSKMKSLMHEKPMIPLHTDGGKNFISGLTLLITKNHPQIFQFFLQPDRINRLSLVIYLVVQMRIG
jgi:hypothetical protein